MTGSLLLVPEEGDTTLLDEAHRLAEALAVEHPTVPVAGVDGGGDGAQPATAESATGERPSVVAVAFDGLVDPDTLRTGAPDEIRHVVRDDGAFTAGAAGVRDRAAALAEIAEAPRAVLLPDTADGADLAAATASRLRGACVTDCLLRVRDGELRAGRPAYGGRAYAELSFEGGPPVVTLDTEALGSPSEPPDSTPTERVVDVTVEGDDRVRHVETLDVPESDLAKARRIVAGGFGLGNPDGFGVIEELAGALGATVGASRPPADEGWVEYDRQIGVTGKEIDAELYVPCAISGDSYHMRSVNAEYLIPINSDPDARIFTFADIGIVGDVYEHGPALAAAIRRANGEFEGEAGEESQKESERKAKGCGKGNPTEGQE